MIGDYETVHLVTDYYDGPRCGVADVNGLPHLYSSTWSDIGGDGDDVFELRAVDGETLQLALESWAIWLRWEDAFHAGATGLDTHPALPAERERYDALDGILERRVAAVASRLPDLRAHADFRVAQDRPRRLMGGQPLQVRWREVF